MNFDLTDPASYKAYYQKIAKENKLLGELNFLFGEVEVGQSEASEWTGKKLWAWPAYKGRMHGDDNFFIARDASVWVGGSSLGEKFSEKDTFYFECEIIIKQILSKMMQDYADTKLSTQFGNCTIQRADMMLGGTLFIGCELLFNFDDPEGFEYNEAHWNRD